MLQIELLWTCCHVIVCQGFICHGIVCYRSSCYGFVVIDMLMIFLNFCHGIVCYRIACFGIIYKWILGQWIIMFCEMHWKHKYGRKVRKIIIEVTEWDYFCWTIKNYWGDWRMPSWHNPKKYILKALNELLICIYADFIASLFFSDKEESKFILCGRLAPLTKFKKKFRNNSENIS